MAAKGNRSRKQTKKKTASRAKAAEQTSFRGEVILWVSLAVCILLFLSNFGIIGVVGNALSSVLFGIFGVIAYVFPILLFVAIAFAISNAGLRKATVKLVSGGVFVLFICGLIQIITNHTGNYNPWDAFLDGFTHHHGGGFLGGIVTGIFCTTIGTVGAVVVTLAALVISAVLFTGKSAWAPIKRGSKKVYEAAKEEQDYRREYLRERREVRKEERRQLRMEKKAAGVSLDTALSAPEDHGISDEIAALPDEESGVYTQKKRTSRIAPMDRDMKELLPEDYPEEADLPSISEQIAAVPLETEEMSPDIVHQAASVFPVGAEVRMEVPPAEEPERTPVELTDFSEEVGDMVREAEMSALLNRAMMDQQAPEMEAPIEEPNVPAPSPVYETPSPGVEWFSERESGMTEESCTEDDSASLLDPYEGMGYDSDVTHSAQENAEAFAAAPFAETSAAAATAEETFAGAAPIEEAPVVAAPIKATSAGAPVAETAPAVMPAGETSAASSEGQPKKRPYIYPPVSLLSQGNPAARGDTEESLRETADKLKMVLETFGVRANITNVSCGPAVTRYELQPEMGVKVSRIVGLADDIKLNLAAADIRIEAPIPGKAAIGIEVPNKESVPVMFRELVDSPEFKKEKSNIAFCAGKDIAGKPIIADIAKMPHVLIAGATGSGKSVCINTIVMSILYHADPEDVKLIMVDPKVVELSVYNGIPHLLIPVVTDPKKAAGALNWAVAEMTDRYQKFAKYQVRKIDEFNAKVANIADIDDPNKPVKMPHIVVIVDELADLMMVAPGDVEDAICRLAQLARACGIHLVIATQRPSVNVITGLIKANMPSRIAFAVSSGVDSRTILDMVGAEKLLGKGDMLFYPQGIPKPIRVQGAFVSDKEVSDVVEFLKEHNGIQEYDSTVENAVVSAEGKESSAGGNADSGGDGRDEYFMEAARVIIDKDKASIGMLQRFFKIGFNRAARIMDQLEEAGVVGPEAGTKPREILMSEEQFENYLEEFG